CVRFDLSDLGFDVPGDQIRRADDSALPDGRTALHHLGRAALRLGTLSWQRATDTRSLEKRDHSRRLPAAWRQRRGSVGRTVRAVRTDGAAGFDSSVLAGDHRVGEAAAKAATWCRTVRTDSWLCRNRRVSRTVRPRRPWGRAADRRAGADPGILVLGRRLLLFARRGATAIGITDDRNGDAGRRGFAPD